MTPDFREDGLYVVRTFSNDLDARLAEAVLEANGIESIVVGDNAAGMMPYLNAMHPIRLLVQESDVESAVSLLEGGNPAAGDAPATQE